MGTGLMWSGVALFLFLIWITQGNKRTKFENIGKFIDETPRWQLFLFAAFAWLWLVICALYLVGSPLIEDVIDPKLTTEKLSEYERQRWLVIDPAISNFQVNRWRSIVQMVPVVIGLPIAFLLWFWRDRNVRDQIANAKREISLTEFQEVQLRASGALDRNLDENGVNVIQIASLYQLRIFLGKDDTYFRRPALELLLAGHAYAMDKNLKTKHLEGTSIVGRKHTGTSLGSPANYRKKLRKSEHRVIVERMGIIREEAETLFTTPKLDLDGRTLDLLDLRIPPVAHKLDFTASSFFGASLCGSTLKGHRFEGCRFYGTDLRGTDWQRAGSLAGAKRDEFTQLNSDSNIAWENIVQAEKEKLWAIFDEMAAKASLPSNATTRSKSVAAGEQSESLSASATESND